MFVVILNDPYKVLLAFNAYRLPIIPIPDPKWINTAT